ncbi:MAG TPA: KTSC domain-containing protein [Negativicutes bacterium]|nr:KTSC domain-containing protein [Negativicutes bacterium]
MQRTYVMSTDIKSIGYDEGARILEIEFLDSSIYQYKNVPKIAHIALMMAQSKGLLFHTDIKNVYPCEKIADGVQ